MEGAVMIGGRPGSGKTALMRALIDTDPDSFRCLTNVTTRRPWCADDVVHPTNKSWSEFSYWPLQMFRSYEEMGHFITTNSDVAKEGESLIGVLAQTVQNCVDFHGCVITTGKVDHIVGFREIFELCGRTVPGFYIDVPEGVLYDRMVNRGDTDEEARKALRLTEDWPHEAAELGYTFIPNPHDSDGFPRVALECICRKLGLQAA